MHWIEFVPGPLHVASATIPSGEITFLIYKSFNISFSLGLVHTITVLFVIFNTKGQLYPRASHGHYKGPSYVNLSTCCFERKY